MVHILCQKVKMISSRSLCGTENVNIYMFILYTSPVGNIMHAFDISFHAYADDLQLYAEFDPRSEGDCERVLARLSSCIDVINEWMIQNMLHLNQDKTEFFLIANRNVSAALSDISLKLDELSIQRSTLIKNLSITFDDSLTMYSQINTTCKSVNFHIHNIWRIRRFITTETCHHIVRGLVHPRLDYANSVLFGACEADLTRLQRLQNKAVRLVMSCGRDQSSVDLLKELHWLPVKQRIIYKLMLYIYKALNNMAPWYISAMTHLQNIDPAEYRQRLQSSSDQTLASCFQIFQRCQWHELYYRCCSPLEWSSCLSTWITVLAYVQEAAENSLVSIIFVLFFILFLL